MGNLHEGHLQLIRLARQHADVVVASIFVNPLQFGLNEDWEQYPRTLERDSAMLASEGCDLLFCPTEHDMYPNGMETQTKVEVPTMTNILCGASRPGHFLGVTTVVAKLFNMVQPDTAVFGIKDYQQLAVIRRMTEDLVHPGPDYRCPDCPRRRRARPQLAQWLPDPEERPRAVALYQALCQARAALVDGRRDYASIEKEAWHATGSGQDAAGLFLHPTRQNTGNSQRQVIQTWYY
jgi:pantoate--beta-alanine ligase